MIEFRDKTVAKLGMDLIVHINPEGIEQGVGPLPTAHPSTPIS